MERKKIGDYLILTCTELAEFLNVTRQSVDQKLHGKKAMKRGFIVYNGVEYQYIYIGERTPIFYIKYFDSSRV